MAVRTRRVMFTAPSSLLERVDETVTRLETTRSSLIREALEQYLAEQRRRDLVERLEEGYRDRARESLEFADEFRTAEREAWDRHAPWEDA
jgi:metal-responsive CopG/Arc/MetJ family transcriptional regulator